MIILDCVQGDEVWHSAKLGNPGASSGSKIIKPNGEPSKSADKYLDKCFDELVWGRPIDNYSNFNMERGLVEEAVSIEDYEFKNGIVLERVGLIYKDERKAFHCSPDAINQELRMGFETKSALPHIQRDRLKSGKVEGAHWVQCQMSLYVTGYDYWVYQSYSENMQPLTIEVLPDLDFHKKLEDRLNWFTGTLANMVKEYRRVK